MDSTRPGAEILTEPALLHPVTTRDLPRWRGSVPGWFAGATWVVTVLGVLSIGIFVLRCGHHPDRRARHSPNEFRWSPRHHLWCGTPSALYRLSQPRRAGQRLHQVGPWRVLYPGVEPVALAGIWHGTAGGRNRGLRREESREEPLEGLVVTR